MILRRKSGGFNIRRDTAHAPETVPGLPPAAVAVAPKVAAHRSAPLRQAT